MFDGKYLNTLILHFRPKKVPERTLNFTLSWGLGGSAVVFIAMLFSTGFLLLFNYDPFPGLAYESITVMQQNSIFGQLIRNIHHWSGTGIILVTFLHLLRVYFTGAYQGSRRINWIIGLGLMASVVLANFTGYLLPWDQLSYWAITICMGLLEYVPFLGISLQRMVMGSSDIGPKALSIFYVIHTTVLPTLLIILMSFHFWKIRKSGGLVHPLKPDEVIETPVKRVPAIPDLLVREIVVGVTLFAAVLLFAMFFDAPLGAKANPGLSPNPTKAPWYFMGFQEMLMHIHPFFVITVIPICLTLFLCGLPYLRYETDSSGIWFGSRNGRKTAAITAGISLILTPVMIVVDEYLLDFPGWFPNVTSMINTGLIPFALIAVFFVLLHILLKFGFSTTRHETVQAFFVLMTVTFIILTITGILFRGESMCLTWFGRF